MVLKKNDPLRLDVSYLVKGSPGTHKEFEFSFPQLNLSSELTLVDIQGKIVISVTEDGVVAEGKFRALTHLDCSRCLNDFWQPLEISFTEIFQAHPAEDSEEQPFPADGSIDLTPIIRDYATLDIPIRHLCAEDCKGLCVVCGMNLNKEDCGHRQESIDPRMAELQKFFNKENSTD
ncbi:MAG: DUF177 domain-containing protein [Anaerolineales bacterium]|nr:DUF177 domain-containing protein [Anaerolineales bacterium]